MASVRPVVEPLARRFPGEMSVTKGGAIYRSEICQHPHEAIRSMNMKTLTE